MFRTVFHKSHPL